MSAAPVSPRFFFRAIPVVVHTVKSTSFGRWCLSIIIWWLWSGVQVFQWPFPALALDQQSDKSLYVVCPLVTESALDESIVTQLIHALEWLRRLHRSSREFTGSLAQPRYPFVVAMINAIMCMLILVLSLEYQNICTGSSPGMKTTVNHRPFSDQLLPCSAKSPPISIHHSQSWSTVCHVLDNFSKLMRTSDDLFRIQLLHANHYGADDQHPNGRPIMQNASQIVTYMASWPSSSDSNFLFSSL